MKICSYKYFILLSFALVSFVTKASAINIDEFDGDASLTASVNNSPLSTVVTNSSAIGGRRSMYVRKTAGTGDILLRTITGRLKTDQGNDDRGFAIITWDGDNTADSGVPSNPTGLGGIDLTEDNGGITAPADAFLLKLTADLGFNQPITLRIYVYSGVSAGSFAAVTISNDLAAETVISFPYANFTTIPSPGFSPADFTNAGSIVLEIDGSNPANDIDIRSISTNGECPDFPQNGTVYTACNKCLSAPNNLDCLDCLGVPFGTATPGTACATGDVGVCADGKYEVNCQCKRITEPGTEICDGKDNDCDGQVDENTDVCGICGGDGKSCLDCASVPFGNAKKDVCGVCNGDGKSCLDCAGTPNGTAVKDKCGVCNGDNTSCLDCTEQDISDKQFLLDHGAKLHEKLIKKMLKALGNYDKSAEGKAYAKTVAAKAHELQLRNWVISWTFVSKIQVCGNTVLCTQVSNTSNVDEYKTHSLELRDLGKDVLARLKKYKFNTKKLARDNESRHKSNTTLADEIPKTYSGGCNV